MELSFAPLVAAFSLLLKCLLLLNACSREFNHRVKSVSMATFKPEEIEKLKRIGNAVCTPFFANRRVQNAKKIWLAKWNPVDYPEPEANQISQIRVFMQDKVIK